MYFAPLKSIQLQHWQALEGAISEYCIPRNVDTFIPGQQRPGRPRQPPGPAGDHRRGVRDPVPPPRAAAGRPRSLHLEVGKLLTTSISFIVCNGLVPDTQRPPI